MKMLLTYFPQWMILCRRYIIIRVTKECFLLLDKSLEQLENDPRDECHNHHWFVYRILCRETIRTLYFLQLYERSTISNLWTKCIKMLFDCLDLVFIHFFLLVYFNCKLKFYCIYLIPHRLWVLPFPFGTFIYI